MSTECDRIAYQLASTINGEAWYGDSLRQILDGVTAKQAHAHPVPNAHSIWELLCHVESWVKFALGAVDGVPIPPWPAMPVELDWPAVTDTWEPVWRWWTHFSRIISNWLKRSKLSATNGSRPQFQAGPTLFIGFF